MSELVYRPFDELKEVHPATERWLTQHGYKFDHHVTMPVYGVADYVATSSEGKLLVIECKSDCDNMGRTLIQVLDYAAQMGGVQAAVTVPFVTVTGKAGRVCKRRSVRLIPLSIEPHYIEAVPAPDIPQTTLDNMNSFAVALSLFRKCKDHVGRILDLHQMNITAIGDLLWARDMATDFYCHIFQRQMKPYCNEFDGMSLMEVKQAYDDGIWTVAPFLPQPYEYLDRNIMPLKYKEVLR